jgi:hypothetical protein
MSEAVSLLPGSIITSARCDGPNLCLTIAPRPEPKKTVHRFLVQIESETDWHVCNCETCLAIRAAYLEIFLLTRITAAFAHEDPLKVFPQLARIEVRREP